MTQEQREAKRRSDHEWWVRKRQDKAYMEQRRQRERGYRALKIRDKAWIEKERQRKREYLSRKRKDRSWLEEQRRKWRDYRRAYRARKRQDKMWVEKHRKNERARVKAYYEAHPEKRREHYKKFRALYGTKYRINSRISHAVKLVTKGVIYKPRFHMRKPDYVPVGESGIDVRSQWLINNLTDSQRAYARELAIERKERMAR